ncbi:MAG: phosphate-starvation-inducible PsiE family protein [Pseudomonadota bacterium]|uniref:phosphate-starvation-inducible PsiE family protein n=1 Tax=Thermithiobacillus tepidarius TaxID=929 RepID=UPI0003F76471|nr:phosphate-starvation-inducible PsiE family protein [Thermithiobacillus tepidarius]
MGAARRALLKHYLSLSSYKRFELLVSYVLVFLISIIILIALYRLAEDVLFGLLSGVLNPLDHKAFQNIFGEIMTVLIAMEFRYSILRVIGGRESIIQVKTVILIALLALSRKFIILDLHETDALMLIALAAVTLALGAVYWMMRERDDRHLPENGTSDW